MANKIPENFEVQVYGELQKYSDTISRGRVRIFYRGLNRNSTYISEEFANFLIKTLPYAPVKGEYGLTEKEEKEEVEKKDFGDHGTKRSNSNIYGVVPDSNNFRWEWHTDKDGVEREYATCDVLLYTAIYPEASEIFGHSQSMELHKPSIKGEWQIIDGSNVYVFKEASFLGLQVLGDKIEPCFEGAEFFSLYNKLLSRIEGGKRMINFKIAESETYQKIFNILNKSENDVIEAKLIPIELHENSAIVYDCEQNATFHYEFELDENQEMVAKAFTRVKLIEAQDDEFNALQLLREANGNTFNNINEVFTQAANKVEELLTTINTKEEEYSLQSQELQTKIDLLATKEEELATKVTEYTNFQAETEGIIAAKDSIITNLEQFKADIELQEKKDIVARFTKLKVLDESVIAEYLEKIDSFSASELKKELAGKVYDQDPENFGRNIEEEEEFKIPTGIDKLTGAAKIIAKHKKEKNGGK